MHRPECEIVGNDRGTDIYAFRTQYEGTLRPGKARVNAFICYSTKEELVKTGQLLRKGNYEWVYGRQGSVPPNAVVAGNDGNGNPYYLGRAIIEGTLTPGFIEPSHKLLYVPYNGTEHTKSAYTVLCYKATVSPARGSNLLKPLSTGYGIYGTFMIFQP